MHNVGFSKTTSFTERTFQIFNKCIGLVWFSLTENRKGGAGGRRREAVWEANLSKPYKNALEVVNLSAGME